MGFERFNSTRDSGTDNPLSKQQLAMLSRYMANEPIEPSNKNPFLNKYAETGPHTDIFHGRRTKSKTEVLVKVWRISRTYSSPRVKIVESLCAALELWRRASAHHGVTDFIGLTTEGFSDYVPALALPKYANGSAIDYFQSRPHLDVYPTIVDIADALRFLHEQSPPIVHGMLYGQNILISDSGRPLLTDIGISDLIENIRAVREYEETDLQRVRWMASDMIDPTIAEADSNLTGDASQLLRPSSDVYSFGMTVLELTTRRRPFCRFRHPFQVIVAVAGGKRPLHEECPEVESEELWEILEGCWQQLPSRRPTMEAVHSQLVSLNRQQRSKL